jgi:hypothetical protein
LILQKKNKLAKGIFLDFFYFFLLGFAVSRGPKIEKYHLSAFGYPIFYPIPGSFLQKKSNWYHGKKSFFKKKNGSCFARTI